VDHHVEHDLVVVVGPDGVVADLELTGNHQTDPLVGHAGGGEPGHREHQADEVRRHLLAPRDDGVVPLASGGHRQPG
jgi:hypothetical protein